MSKTENPAPAPKADPIEYRNDEAGFVEFINEDRPYIVRDLPAPCAILTDMETRNVIGYRVYDPVSQPPSPHLSVPEQFEDWWATSRFREAPAERYSDRKQLAWSAFYAASQAAAPQSKGNAEECFTVVFRGNLRKLQGNPMRFDTAFGPVMSIAMGDPMAPPEEHLVGPSHLKRYDLVTDTSSVLHDRYMEEHPEGDWVKFDEVNWTRIDAAYWRDQCQWQDINAAPKTGEEIIGRTETGLVFACKWELVNEIDGCWIENGCVVVEPTGWISMPLTTEGQSNG